MSAKKQGDFQDFPIYVSSHFVRALETPGGQTSIILTAPFQIGGRLRTACIGHRDSFIVHRAPVSFFVPWEPWTMNLDPEGALAPRIAFAVRIAGRSKEFLSWLGDPWTCSMTRSLVGHRPSFVWAMDVRHGIVLCRFE